MNEWQNVVGPQVRKLRNDQGWSQEEFAARLNLVGWDISRATLAKIEAQLRCVTDSELLHLAKALKIEVQALFRPEINRKYFATRAARR